MRQVKSANQAQSAKGRFHCVVIDAATQEVVQDHGWQDNLILDQGLNQVASRAWCDNFLVACIGTNTEPTFDSGGASTASQSGFTVTIDSGVFTFTAGGLDVGDEGKWIKFLSGEEAKITAYISSTQVTVAVSQTVASTTFKLDRCNQTALYTEIQRTNNYVTGAGNCQTTRSSNVLTHRRTWDFPTEVGPVTYRELGVSYNGVGPGNLFSRIVLSSPVSLIAAQILRVSYELVLTITPFSPVVVADPNIGGWPIAPSVTDGGVFAWQMIGLSAVSTSGPSAKYDNAGYCNEPFANSFVSTSVPTGNDLSPFTQSFSVDGARMFLSNSANAPASFASSVNRNGDRATIGVTLSSYTAGTFTRNKSATYGLSAANRVDWRAMGIGAHDASSDATVDHSTTRYSGIVFVFDEFQTKLSTHTLNLVFKYSWGRTLPV